MIEAIVVIMGLHSNDIISVGHFVPKKEFVSMQECVEWLDSAEGEQQTLDLGSGYVSFFRFPIDIKPACYRPTEARQWTPDTAA